jgi:hemerythrin-like domain-containing protein
MTSSEHELLQHGLNVVHLALRRSLASIVRTAEAPISDADRAAFVEFTERFARFLHVHHDGEEEIVFPMLGRPSSPDAKKLVDGWKEDHATLIPKLRAMESACADFARGGAREPLAQAAKAVQDFLVPHLDAEERALDTATLAKLLTSEEATALALAASKHGQRVGGSVVLMLLLHSLTDEEQRSHFSAMPWFVRKVLVGQVWKRGFRRCVKYAHNPAIVI